LTEQQKYRPGDEIHEGRLYHRLPPGDVGKWSTRRRKPTAYVFVLPREDEHMSTQLAEMTSPEKIFEKYPNYGLLELDVRELREFGLTVRYMPEKGTDHAAVYGLKGLTSSVKERLAKRVVRAWEPGTQQLVYERDEQPPGLTSG
jgi:hypothetical protein